MNKVEVILSIKDLVAARAEVEKKGGALRHVLTDHMIVAALPSAVAAAGLRHAQPVDPTRVGLLEKRLLDALNLKRKPRARAASQPVRTWDTPGFQPPAHPQEDEGKLLRDDGKSRRAGSTNTPTSKELRGSVAVGVVMVSGPSKPWVPVAGALKQVSVASDGTVWGVNAADKIYHFGAGVWDPIAGSLKQISVGSSSIVWGVNADDQIYRRAAGAWQQVPGRLKQVSAAADGTVWGVNAADEVFRRDGSSWTRMPGALKQISVGASNIVWGVNASNKIYRWNGTRWTVVPGALSHISAGSDSAIWGVNASQKIYFREGSSWTLVPGALKQISVGAAMDVWGVNAGDHIYSRGSTGFDLSAAQRLTIMAEVMEGLAFLASAEPEANVSFTYDWHEVDVDVGAGTGSGYEAKESPWRDAALKKLGFAGSRQGSVDYVKALRTSRKTDSAYVAYFTRYPLHHFGYASGERLVIHYDNDGWGPNSINQVFAHETCHIFGAADEYESSGCDCKASGHNDTPNLNCFFCTPSQAACLMNANTLTLCPWSRGQLGWSIWRHISGSLLDVSASADGQVWGCNGTHQIYRRNGAAWTRVPGSLRQISVAREGLVWGVNKNDKIYRWNGRGWTQVAGTLRHVSVGSDGTVWGVNADSKIYRWNGTDWTQVAGALRQISVGSASAVWGVNSRDEIYRWSGSAWQKQTGKLKHVSVAADGTVWGTNAANNIYKWSGGSWEQRPGALTQVCAGSSARVWGVNAEQQIYQLK